MPQVVTGKVEFTSNQAQSREDLERDTSNFAEIFSAVIKNFLAFAENFLACVKNFRALHKTCHHQREPILIFVRASSKCRQTQVSPGLNLVMENS